MGRIELILLVLATHLLYLHRKVIMAVKEVQPAIQTVVAVAGLGLLAQLHQVERTLEALEETELFHLFQVSQHLMLVVGVDREFLVRLEVLAEEVLGQMQQLQPQVAQELPIPAVVAVAVEAQAVQAAQASSS